MATLTQAALTTKTLEAMEDDLRISPKQARDFLESARAVIEESIENGDKVAVFGIVTLTPKGTPAKPKRKGRNPATGEEVTLAPKPAGVKVRATVGKRVKDALPKADSKAGKALIKAAKDAAAKRA